MKRWDRRGRTWAGNREVHFLWESPVMALVMLVALALVMAVL